jgi:lysophospholipase L1-like esterase
MFRRLTIALLTLAVGAGVFGALGASAASAREKDPAWPSSVGWQGCPAPVWPSALAQGAPGEGRRVLVVGDSHIRNALTAVKAQLRQSGWTPTIRCWGGKRLDWGRDQIARAKKLGNLPQIVVIALGTNDMRWIDRGRTRERMAALVRQLGPERTVFWVDTYAGNADRFTTTKQRWFNAEVRRLAQRNPRMHVIPWGSRASRAGVRFVDGLHFRPRDYRFMADLIVDEIDRVVEVPIPAG